MVSGKSFSLTPRNDLRNFYSSFNSLYNSNMRPNEIVLMRLLFSICVPHLTYVADVKDLSYADMQKCNTALNNAVRKIFSFHRWESIRSLREGLGYPDLHSIFATRCSSFTLKLSRSSNLVIKHLYQLLCTV